MKGLGLFLRTNLFIVLSIIILCEVAYDSRRNPFPAGILTPWLNTIQFVEPTGGTGTALDPYTHSDNTGGIQTALNTHAGRIYVPDGNYSVTTTIRIFDGQILEGNSPDQVILLCSGASSHPCVSLGDTTHATSTSHSGTKRLHIICSGLTAGQACYQMNAAKHCTIEDLFISLTTNNDPTIGCNNATAFHVNSAKGPGKATGPSFWNAIKDIYIWAGVSGNNKGLWLDGNGTSWISGRTNSNNWYNINIQGGKYPLKFGASFSNSIYGLDIENQCNSVNGNGDTTCIGDPNDGGVMVDFDTYSSDNVIYRFYDEPASDYTGKHVRVSHESGANAAGVTLNPYNNEIYAIHSGAGLGKWSSGLDLIGSNYVHQGSNIYAQTPDENGTVEKAWPISIKQPGVQYPLLRIGLTGVQISNGSVEQYLMPVMLSKAGPTNTISSFTGTQPGGNPDLDKGRNFFITNFNTDRTITGTTGGDGAPDIIFEPYPTVDGVSLSFIDNATTDLFYLYPDDNPYDDNVTITGVGTGTTVVTFMKSNNRYPMFFKSYLGGSVRSWFLMNHVASVPYAFRQGMGGYTLQVSCARIAAPSSGTFYFVGGLFADPGFATSSQTALYIPKSGVIRSIFAHFSSESTASDNSTLSVYTTKDNITSISTIRMNASANVKVENSGLNLRVEEGNMIYLRWLTPTWAGTPPSGVRIGATIYIE